MYLWNLAVDRVARTTFLFRPDAGQSSNARRLNDRREKVLCSVSSPVEATARKAKGEDALLDPFKRSRLCAKANFSGRSASVTMIDADEPRCRLRCQQQMDIKV